MSGVRILALAGAAAMISTGAWAADFPPPIPQALPVAQPAAVESGWYLRGDVGVGAQSFNTFDHFQTNPVFVWPSTWQIVQHSTDDAALVDFGLGYQVNNWLRFDVTAQYRAAAQFKAVGSYTNFCPGGANCFDNYNGQHAAEVFLANAYVDLGTWWCLTPFIGAGVGGAYNNISTLTDTGMIADGTSALGYSSANNSSWTFAWATHAGLAYNVSNNLKLEFAWTYLNMGSPRTPVVDCASSGCVPTAGQPAAYYQLGSFTSQDFTLGLRWMLQPEQVYQPPLIRKG